MKFIHTSDWQLGMVRDYLLAEAQARFSGDRIDTIHDIGQLAHSLGADFVVVAGDIFETNYVPENLVARALDTMADFDLPFLLVAGNHDPLNSNSVLTSHQFRDSCPDNVCVLGLGERKEIAGVEIVSAAWTTKKPSRNPLMTVLDELEPATKPRVVVGHGMMDVFPGDADDPGRLALRDLEDAISEGKASYIALGDRHICWTSPSGAVAYSGTHESTSWREPTPGTVLEVEITDSGSVNAVRREIGRWRHTVLSYEFFGDETLDGFVDSLAKLRSRMRTALDLRLTGVLSLHGKVRLNALIDEHAEEFAAVKKNHISVAAIPDDADFGEISDSGYMASAIAELKERALAGVDDPATDEGLSDDDSGELAKPDSPSGTGLSEDAQGAQDALMLLYQLYQRNRT